MTDHARDDALVIVYDREIHLETDVDLAVGDKVPVIRGNGLHEGDPMGAAIVTGLDDDGELILAVRLGDAARRPPAA